MLFTGCAPTWHKPSAHTEIPAVQEPQDDLNELMHYYNSLQDKSELELAWEYNYANSHYRESTDTRERLKLLMLLLLPNTNFQSIPTALDLLENSPQPAELSSSLAAFENILTLLLKQQESANIQVQNLSAKLRATEAEVKILQNKIDAIKNIEKNLMRRNAP